MTVRRFRLAPFLVALAVLTAAPVAIARAYDQPWFDLEPGPAPQTNPLKGFVPFAPEPGDKPSHGSGALPYSMEWFYLPVNDIVTGPDTYDWKTLDKWLDSIAARGHQSAFRLYLDYPGRQTGVPQYLIDAGIDTSRRYTQYGNNNTSFSPDYDDPRIQQMLVDLIAALGARYDGDPRIGYITQGLIGFWGESHTYPMDGSASPENWMPSAATQAKLVAAWDDAFDTTATLARYPTADNEPADIGYHDDSFGYATLATADWHFLAKLNAAGAADTWQTAPIGGEIYPEIQSCLFEQSSCATDDVTGAITGTHVSWLINQGAFSPGYGGDERTRALNAQASFGYILRPTQARLTTNGDLTTVGVRIANDGVAPFYYDWPLQAALVDDSDRIVAMTQFDGSIDTILPDRTAELTATIPVENVAADTYTVVLRVVNPLDKGLPVRFAAAGQDRTLTGWTTLGTVDIKNGPTVAGPTPTSGTPTPTPTPTYVTPSPTPTPTSVTPTPTPTPTYVTPSPTPSTTAPAATPTHTASTGPTTTPPQQSSRSYATTWRTDEAENVVEGDYGYGYGPGYGYGWGTDYAWAWGDGWSYGWGPDWSYANGDVDWDFLAEVGHLLP